MARTHLTVLAVGTALAVAGCGGGEAADDEAARDLSMAPAESVSALADTTDAMRPAPPPAPTGQTRPAQPARTAPRETPPPAPPATVTLTAPEGTIVMLIAGDTLTSRHNEKGEPVTATNMEAVLDADGRVVIPPTAVFVGTISDIAPAENPGGEGRMVLTFNRVRFAGAEFEIQARTDSIGSYMKGRGVTAGDAAKVGAGAVVGAVAGRIIGGNRTGTIVGAAAGAAAGAGIAAATRDIDIILPEGAPIRLVLTAPFEIEMAR